MRLRTMDASFRQLLEHRVGSHRADQLVADYADGLFDACKEIAIALGAADAHGHNAMLHVEAPVTRESTWNGNVLRIPNTLPDTLIAAMPGRRLGDLVRHPGLPADRQVECVDVRDDGTVDIVCGAEIVPARSLVRRRDSALSTWARRRQEAETLRYGMRQGACRHIAGYPLPGLVCMALALLLTFVAHAAFGGAWTWTTAMGAFGIAFGVMGATDAHDNDMSEGDGYHWMRDRVSAAHRRMTEALADSPCTSGI